MKSTTELDVSSEITDDLLRRGFSRRAFGRLFAVAAAGTTSLPFLSEPGLAQLSNIGRIPSDAIKINANEFPLGLTPAATAKLVEVAERGNRYQYEEMEDFMRLIADVEGVPFSQVSAYPGSSLALLHIVLAFSGPDAPLITVSPGYEAAARGAEFIGAEAIRVPLLADGSHDVKKMVAEAKRTSAGLIYVCNPNNPTGSTTTRENIDWLMANKPSDTKVLIDEAYIHFTDDKPCNDLVGRDDVLVLRTFSKIYGMAGLRAGYLLAKEELKKKHIYTTCIGRKIHF
ncbi:MAG: aminotransferase class I/II-fold pyridoxal phosphate-dependent enzyme [Acidobacteriota bacterium]